MIRVCHTSFEVGKPLRLVVLHVRRKVSVQVVALTALFPASAALGKRVHCLYLLVPVHATHGSRLR